LAGKGFPGPAWQRGKNSIGCIREELHLKNQPANDALKRRRKMKKLVVFLMVVGLLTAGSGMALATEFYGLTNQLGYQGTIWNITDNTGPWTTSIPRDAALYTVVNAPQIYTNYNCLLSNWSEHAVSNTNDSFFQLGEAGNASVTSANGFWSADLKRFEMTVNGANLPYSTGYSRFWQPDVGVAWGVTFTNYSYTFTATFPTAASLDGNGFYVNSNSNTIVGLFSGEFVVTSDVNKNPITNGDTYGFNIALSQAMLDPLDLTDSYYGTLVVPYSEFGSTQVVPLPGTLVLLGSGLAGLAVWRKRRAIAGQK
jgi:hypothetical protein